MELFDVVEDIRLYVHKSLIAKFELIVFTDELGEPWIDELQDAQEDVVFEEWPKYFVSRELLVSSRIPMDSFSSPANVIKHDCPVLMVEACRSLCFRVVGDIDNVQVVDSLCLYIIVFSDLIVNPLQRRCMTKNPSIHVF